MILALVCTAALAQEAQPVSTVDSRQLRPAASSTRYLWTEDAGRRVIVGGSLQALLSYTDGQVVDRDASGARSTLLDDVLLTDLHGTLAVDRFRLAVGAPLVVASDAAGGGSTRGLGDMDLGLRVTALDRVRAPVGLGLSGRLQLPTGGPTLMAESGTSGEVLVLAEKGIERLRVAGNLGARLRPEAEVGQVALGTQVLARLGLGYELYDRARMGCLTCDDEDQASQGISLDLGLDAGRRAEDGGGGVAASFLAGGWFDLGAGLQLRLAAGSGLSGHLLSPGFQAVGGLSWSATRHRPVPTDSDHDGLLDADDVCPYEKETPDGVRDHDGCPEGVPAGTTSVVTVARQPVDLVMPSAGDRDGDGVLDFAERCPDQAEDVDGFEDLDGCPDPDNDLDRLPDDQDECPLDAETYNGFQDYDGCPEPLSEEAREVVGVVKGILFATGSADLLPESTRTLDLVRELLDEYPALGLRVEGHTDDVGSRDLNLDLSQRRAEAVVQWLVAQGVAAERLRATGHGPDRPLVPNDSEASRQRNRRVELNYRRLDKLDQELVLPEPPPPTEPSP